jgi:hypothetical protein
MARRIMPRIILRQAASGLRQKAHLSFTLDCLCPIRNMLLPQATYQAAENRSLNAE